MYPVRDFADEDWYEGRVDWEVVPAATGPTWDRNPFWKGPRDPHGFILPELTLGWQVIHWIEHNLLAEESSPEEEVFFRLTPEQKRWLLWWYAIDEDGSFVYRRGMLQRIKGWG